VAFAKRFVWGQRVGLSPAEGGSTVLAESGLAWLLLAAAQSAGRGYLPGDGSYLSIASRLNNEFTNPTHPPSVPLDLKPRLSFHVPSRAMGKATAMRWG
jgi:hypothetical protein